MNTTPPTEAPEANPYAGSFFSGTWHTFKTNYGLCLGMTVLLLVVSLVVTLGVEALGFVLASSSGSETGLVVANVLSFAVQILIFVPLAYWIAMRITQRVRGSSGLRAGWYSRALPLIFIYMLFMLPSLILAAMSDPDHYHENNNPIVQISQAIEKGNAGDDYVAAEKDPEFQPPNFALQIGAGALALLGLFFTLPWLPWAILSAVDPLEKTSGIGECLARGRELGRGRAGGIIGTYILIILIMVVSFAACLLPGFFFGLPFALAWSPAVYLTLRGS